MDTVREDEVGVRVGIGDAIVHAFLRPRGCPCSSFIQRVVDQKRLEGLTVTVLNIVRPEEHLLVPPVLQCREQEVVVPAMQRKISLIL